MKGLWLYTHTHTHTHTHTGNLYIKEKNKSIAIFLFFIIFLILNQGKVHAVLQANGNDGTTYNLSNWMINVRKMEELGGAMGLSETVNDNLTSSSTSNNIDVHMEKNTEYGALAILSASSYGNPNKVEDGNTTTGNVTGVVMKINSEWVAAGYEKLTSDIFKNSVLRYKNIYGSPIVNKRGDATDETKGWHDSVAFAWMINESFGLIRSYVGRSIFSYFGGRDAGDVYWSTTIHTREHYSRAVVVSGDGF